MKYYLIVLVFLLITLPISILSYSDDMFVNNSTIAHLETGLFLDYVGLYRPSDTIIHNSVIFPMTKETCHFLPLSAAAKIPACNTTMKRNKRAVPFVIGLGVAGFGLSLLNSAQIFMLNNEVLTIQRSLGRLSETVEIHEAQLVKIQSSQFMLGLELKFTQKALSTLTPVLDSHSHAINKLQVDLEKLQNQVQHSFLYTAITRIFRNQFTLEYLSADDLYKVVYDVVEQGNLTFNIQHGSIPIVEIITKLLVRQQIDFVPSSQYTTQNPKEIGRLVITNFFAVPQQEHTSFYVYKLLAIPFFHGNETIQLSQIPRHWAINPTDNTTMEWHDSEESGCDLQLMTTCRDTPPLRPLSKDTCLGQIIFNQPLSKCHTKAVAPSAVFLRQLTVNLWVTSSFKSLHCLKIPKTEYQINLQQTWNLNEQILLPPVALVNVTSGYTILCPGFSLVGRPRATGPSSLVILYNNRESFSNFSVVDVSKRLTENTTWFRANWAEERMQSLIDEIKRPIAVPLIGSLLFGDQWSFYMLLLKVIFFVLCGTFVYCAFRYQRRVPH